MIKYTAIIKQFGRQGEKTGWTYIEIPAKLAQKLKPGNKKSFRVKGKLDKYAIKAIALLPMGGGAFIMALNAQIRKGIAKPKGATLVVQLEADHEEPQPSKDFTECLKDDPAAMEYFKTLAKGHQHYFSKWIESAKTEPTRVKRISMAVSALAKGWGYPEMLRAQKARNDEFK